MSYFLCELRPLWPSAHEIPDKADSLLITGRISDIEFFRLHICSRVHVGSGEYDLSVYPTDPETPLSIPRSFLPDIPRSIEPHRRWTQKLFHLTFFVYDFILLSVSFVDFNGVQWNFDCLKSYDSLPMPPKIAQIWAHFHVLSAMLHMKSYDPSPLSIHDIYSIFARFRRFSTCL